MKQAPDPDNEQARIAALREYEILDTLPEPAYDDITRIAAQVCGAPVALVSLVDADRQWYKARWGTELRETPRTVAFCAHAIADPTRVMVVEDASRDPRFADNPLVTGEPGIRFYAGAPLVTEAGHALGTLCVIDREPRRLSDAQLESLRALARQVVAQLELRRSLAEVERSSVRLEERNRQVVRSCDELAAMCRLLEDQAAVMERDLNRAEVIQRSLLPHEVPRLEGACLHSLYRPGRNIGGDLFDLAVVDDRYLVLVMADAAGHGVSAAMISMLFKNRLQTTSGEGRPYRPCEALSRLNQAMQHDKPAPGVFVTAVYCVYDMHTRHLLVGSAGHPPVIRVRADGTTARISATGPALGLYADAEFGEHGVELQQGDRILLYTDGLFDGVEEEVTPELVGERLGGISCSTNTLGRLLQSISQPQEPEDRDDVSMVLLAVGIGENYLDEPVDAASGDGEADRCAAQIEYAETESTTFLVLEGRVGWMCGQALLDAALTVMESGRRLVIDLARCEHLDSTVLGTLHELAERATDSGAELVLQNVPARLLEAFRELTLQAVLDRVTDAPAPLPGRQQPLQLPEHSRSTHRQRLLKAHEVLAELSQQNREEFGAVIDALRDENDNDR
ncbi:MAG: SpoIIE family protein phosphatase [Pseudomonadota bacterium]